MKWKLSLLTAMLCFLAVGCADNKNKTGTNEAAKLLSLTADNINILPDNEIKRVFILHSYHKEMAWLKDVNKGILSGFQEERFRPGRNIQLEYFYMDTKRKSDPDYMVNIGKKAIARIAEWKPHVVIASDDNAQEFVLKKLKDSPYPCVFLGVNADPMVYGYIDSQEQPGHNVTGSIERERFGATLGMLRRVTGKPITKLAVICDDGATGRPILDRIKAAAPKLGVQIVASDHIGDFNRWKAFVKDVQTKADALLVVLYHTVKDANGKSVPADDVLNWTVQNNRLPDAGFWDWAVEGGLLCSEAISGYQQGYYAATVASYILLGQSPAEFPIQRPRFGSPTINVARAKMLGIEVSPDLLRSSTVFKTIKSAG
jgi:ABC-type uncharacterized transport system substrate-binding protein